MIMHDKRADYRNASDSVRNEAVRQYLPLINKITGQFHKKLKADWDTLFSMALEGFNEALNLYDPDESSQSFLQFASYRMRFSILNSTNVELHAVALSYYAQQKVREELGSTFTCVSMESISGDAGNDDDTYSREGKYGLYTSPDLLCDPIEEMMKKVRQKFSRRDVDFFVRFYGVGGVQPEKAKDLAKEWKVSGGLVSQRIKAILEFIRSDETIMDNLSDLMDK